MTKKTFQEKYVPKSLSSKDKKQQTKELKNQLHNIRKKYIMYEKKLKVLKVNLVVMLKMLKKMYKVDKIIANDKLSKKTKCDKKSLQKIVKKGMGAYYSSGSRPNQTPHSWGRARLASAITGGPSSKVDYHILKEGCKPSSKALKLAIKPKVSQVAGSKTKPKGKGIKIKQFILVIILTLHLI